MTDGRTEARQAGAHAPSHAESSEGVGIGSASKKSAVGFTPGPWQFYHDGPSVEPNWHIVTNATWMRVLASIHIEPGNAMDLANARLIAAAPALYEALDMAEKVLLTLTEPKSIAATSVHSAWAQAVDAEQKVRAALAQARGE